MECLSRSWFEEGLFNLMRRLKPASARRHMADARFTRVREGGGASLAVPIRRRGGLLRPTRECVRSDTRMLKVAISDSLQAGSS